MPDENLYSITKHYCQLLEIYDKHGQIDRVKSTTIDNRRSTFGTWGTWEIEKLIQVQFNNPAAELSSN